MKQSKVRIVMLMVIANLFLSTFYGEGECYTSTPGSKCDTDEYDRDCEVSHIIVNCGPGNGIMIERCGVTENYPADLKVAHNVGGECVYVDDPDSYCEYEYIPCYTIIQYRCHERSSGTGCSFTIETSAQAHFFGLNIGQTTQVTPTDCRRLKDAVDIDGPLVQTAFRLVGVH